MMLPHRAPKPESDPQPGGMASIPQHSDPVAVLRLLVSSPAKDSQQQRNASAPRLPGHPAEVRHLPLYSFLPLPYCNLPPTGAGYSFPGVGGWPLSGLAASTWACLLRAHRCGCLVAVGAVSGCLGASFTLRLVAPSALGALQAQSVLGGKASCRRKFVLNLVLMDEQGRPVEKDLSVTASLTYAHDHR